MPYLFIFGRSPELSLYELKSFFPDAKLISPQICRIESNVFENVNPAAFIDQLGGTVKIAEILDTKVEFTPEAVADLLISQAKVKHLEFGVSVYGDKQLPSHALSRIKDLLKTQGIDSRYATAQHDEALTSVVVKKKNLVEILAIKSGDNWVFAQTLAVQDFEDWNKRDYGRPYADAKLGMLPPKIARMAVNLAIGNQNKEKAKDFTILDPFCGMGTILAEALTLGYRVIGSDLDTEITDKCQKNLEWLTKSYPDISASKYKLYVFDATHISEKLAESSVDAITTEPFMGSAINSIDISKITPKDIKNKVKGLEKLYIGCLRDWKKILKPGGLVVIALPEYVIGQQKYFVKKVVDSCENLGYTVVHGPLEYSRPQAIVKREFFVFQKL